MCEKAAILLDPGFKSIIHKISFLTDAVVENPEILEFEDSKIGFQLLMYEIEAQLECMLERYENKEKTDT